MPKVLDPDPLTPKRPSSNVQDYLARKYASLHIHPDSDPAPNGIPPQNPQNPPSPPTSEKQREANRRNAQHSTGPKTPEGKAASSANSRRHGLYSGTMLLSIEDDEDYNRILEDLRGFYRPANSEERYVVEMVAQQRHRLLRHAALETGYLDYKQRRQIENAVWLARNGRPDPFFEEVIPLLRNPEALIPGDLVNLLLGRCFDATLTNARSSLAELTRIENNHRRNLAYWESRLEQLLRDRKRTPATPDPLASPPNHRPFPDSVTPAPPSPPAEDPSQAPHAPNQAGSPEAASGLPPKPTHGRATHPATGDKESTTSNENAGNEPISSPHGESRVMPANAQAAGAPGTRIQHDGRRPRRWAADTWPGRSS